MIEFEGWPKTPRLFRDIVVTEKIDGTNAAVVILSAPEDFNREADETWEDTLRRYGAVDLIVTDEGERLLVGAQSRKRLIFPGKQTDNYGFAAWVQQHAAELVDLLGPGRHFGEWWGQGIQHGYGMDERRFSLFNVHRYAGIGTDSKGLLSTVPTLYAGPYSEDEIHRCLADLRNGGSYLTTWHSDAEGVIVYHSASSQVYKVLIEADDVPKSLRAVA